MVRSTVIGRVVRFFNRLLFSGVDAPDVTHNMTGQLAKRVTAKQPGLDVHTWKPVTLGAKTCHFLVGQAAAQWHRLEAPAVFAQLFEALAVTRRDLDQLRQCVNGLLQMVHLGRRHLQRVSRVIGGQHHAVAVQDQAAIGDDRHNRSAVVFGLGQQIGVTCDLQIHQPRRHQAKAHHHHQPGHQHPQAKARQVGLNVTDHRHRFTGGDWRRGWVPGAAAAAAAA